MPKKFTFPKWLQRTDAEVAEEAKVQDLRRASFGRGHLTREEQMVGRGALLEETARGNLAAAEGDEEAAMFHKAQLANGLALQGRFSEAARHHPDEDMKAHYHDIADAIEMDDNEKCVCPDTTATVDGVNVSLTPRFAAKEIFSQKHGKVVSLIQCSKCGHRNAREPKSRLLISSAAMNQNFAVAKAGEARGMIRDIDILKVK